MLSVENLTKVYATDANAGGVRDIGFTVAAGEFFTLLGPSGCGKTTTLRCVAGLEEPSAGRMTIGKDVIFNSARRVHVPSNLRRLGMVFQSYAVWPHMSVFDNVAFPLRMLEGKDKLPKAKIRKRALHTLETMGLAGLSTRSAAQLSGGQQQRLALARAVVTEPRLILLDEPLSNLDALLRTQMRSELRRLQKESGVTAVYVTHDQSEALALSDRIAVMHNGAIVQIGTPHDIYHRPGNAFVASFIGRSNLLRGEAERNGQGSVIMSAIGPIHCHAPGASAAPPKAALVRPEHVVLNAADGAAGPVPNRFRGEISQVAFLGEATEYVVMIGGTEILVRSMAGQYQAKEIVEVSFPPERTLAIPDDAG